MDDDSVKLYDLTSLCQSEEERKRKNPFRLPLGNLLFKVAEKLYRRRPIERPGLVLELLRNSLILLDRGNPKVSHLSLSDIPFMVYHLMPALSSSCAIGRTDSMRRLGAGSRLTTLQIPVCLSVHIDQLTYVLAYHLSTADSRSQ